MADTTIRAIIKLLVEGGHIPKEVATGLTDVGKAGKKTQQDLSGVGQAAKELNGLLKQYLGAAALGGIIKSSVTEFAELDRAWSSLGFTAKRVGATAEDIARARTQMEALALSGGPLQTTTVPALQKFVTMTGNVDKALAAVKLASDVSETGITDFGSAAAGVASLLQGRVKVAATQFGIDLTDINGKAKTNAALIKEIQATYGGLGDAFDDAANSLDSINARWEQAKQIVGAGFAPALKVIPDLLFHAIGAFKDLGEVAGLVANSIVAVFQGTGRGLAAVFDFKTLLSDPAKYIERIKETQTKNLAEMKDAWSVFTEGIAADHTKAADKVADTTKGLNALIQQATKATAEDDAKAAEQAAQKRLELEHKTAQDVLQAQISAAKEGSLERLALEMALLDDQEKADVEAAKRTGVDVNKVHAGYELQRAAKTKQFDDARVAAEKEITDQLLQLEIDGALDGSIKKYALESDAINRRYMAEIAAAEKAGRSTTTIRKAWEKELSNLTLEFIAERTQAEIDAAQQVTDAKIQLEDAGLQERIALSTERSTEWYDAQFAMLEAHHENELAEIYAQMDREDEALKKGDDLAVVRKQALQVKLKAIDANYATAAKTLAKSEKEYKQQQYFAAAQTAVDALQTIFGHNKAFAVASAIINTAQAVTGALKDLPYPFNIVAAVLVGIAGAVQIRKILSTNPGASGGDTSLGVSAAPATTDSGGSAYAAKAGHASSGMIVPATAPGGAEHPGAPKGRDTVPMWVEEGEIIAPADASKDVIAGKAVIGARSMKGKPIVGGKLSLVPTKRGGAAGHAATGMVVGGAKLSKELMPLAGAGVGSTVKTAMQPNATDATLAKMAETVSAMAKSQASGGPAEPTAIDQSTHIHGDLYGGDEGLRQLTRELDAARRRDSNRVIR